MVIKQMKEPPNTGSGQWFGRVVVELQDFSFVWIQPNSLHIQSEIQWCKKNNKKLKCEQLR
jgi:hypothetical protein